jgi:hypothetical protein
VTRYASEAAELLRRARESGAVPELDPARLVPAARLALRQRRGRLVLRRVVLGTASVAVAAMVTLAVGPWLRHGSPGAIASRSPSHTLAILSAPPAGPAAPGSVIDTGITLQAPPGAPVRLGSADGTVLTLEARGELSVIEQSATRRFSLRRGAVRAQVAHLHDGERFLISTDDAEIEVHGTVFRVSLVDGEPGCAKGRRTRVAVAEGIVSVRAEGHETMVAAGQVWPACAQAAAPGSPDVGNTPARVRTDAARHRPPAPSAPARQTEGLAAANDLFAAAAKAEREHRPDEALRLFTQLLEVAPRGPLAEGAAVQRIKLLATSDPAAARRAAADYLARYPDGFARDDARRLAGNGP